MRPDALRTKRGRGRNAASPEDMLAQCVVPIATLTSSLLAAIASMAYSRLLAMTSREALGVLTAFSTACSLAKGTWMNPARMLGYLYYLRN